MSKLIVNEIEKYDEGQLTITTGTDVSIGSNLTVGGTIAGTLSTAAQTNITSVGTLSSLAVSGNLTVDTNTLFVNAANNNVGIGTSSPSAKLDVSGTTGAIFRYDSLSTYINILPEDANGSARIKFGANSGAAPDLIFINDTNTEIARIRHLGGITVTNGNIAMSNGYGIDFSASAGGGATSSLLDDYEEGTFTPVVSGSSVAGTGTYTIQSGTYTKIGNLVYFGWSTRWSAHTGTGNFICTGLPFTAGSGTLYYVVTPFTYDISLSHTPTAFISAGSSIVFEQINVATGQTIKVPLDTSGELYFSGCYQV